MNLDELLQANGVIKVRSGSAIHRRVTRLAAHGVLARVIPGIYCRSGHECFPHIRAAAICAHDPEAVLTGRSAAAHHLLEHDWPPVITFTSPKRWHIERPWLKATRGTIAFHNVHLWPLPHVDRATAALQIATTEGSRIIDDGLRNNEFSAAGLRTALAALAGSRGNAIRAELVKGSLRHPWSASERDFHALLNRAGITGWRGNLSVWVQRKRYVLDVAFPDLKLAIEVDGWTYHSSSSDFEKDRRRHTHLCGAGWVILHLTPTMIDNEPAWVIEQILLALAHRRKCHQSSTRR
ncbi:DUF559 domain-containing protein [Mariniluteicoccus flavus]